MTARPFPVPPAASDAWRHAKDVTIRNTLTLNWFFYGNCLAILGRIEAELSTIRQLADERLR